MIVNGGVGFASLIRLTQVLFSQGILAGLEVHPTERVKKCVVLRIEIDGLANQRQRFRKTDAAVGKHVAEIVQHGRVLRIESERLAELRLRFVVLLLAVIQSAAKKIYV